jgi:hypothetical protein
MCLTALALGLAGCGGHTASSPSASTPAARSAGTEPGATARPFAGLRSRATPSAWSVAHLPDGAALPYPAGWTRIHSDPTTASAALFGPGHRFLGYLNLTPRQGQERLASWARFRVAHNADENDRHVRTLATSGVLALGGGRAVCVEDAYTTSSKARYIEIACLAVGRRAGVVIVGASPPGSWSRVAPLIERAISGVKI